MRLARSIAVLCLCAGPALAQEGGGGLSQAQLGAAMRPYTPAFRTCVERQHRLAPEVTGRLDLTFTLARQGRPSRLEILSAGHRGTFASGCVDGVIRSVKFPAFEGDPVVVPHLPVDLGGDELAPPPAEEDEDERPPPSPEGSKKARAEVQKKLQAAADTIRACVRDQPAADPPGRKKKRKRGPPPVGPLSLELVINPLGRVEQVEVLTPAHRKDHVAGCVTGVLLFTEFPPQGADTLRYTKVALPRL